MYLVCILMFKVEMISQLFCTCEHMHTVQKLLQTLGHNRNTIDEQTMIS